MSNKGSINFLVLAVILAVVIIGGAVMFASKRDAGPAPTEPPSVEFNGEQVILQELYQICGESDRCIVVDTHCGFCCKYTAINASFEPMFNKAFDKNCGRYTGQFCQCFDLSSYPACVEGKCQLVGWPEDGAKMRPPTQPRAQQAPPPVPAPAIALPAPAPQPAEPQIEEPLFEEPVDEPMPDEPIDQAPGDSESQPDDEDLFAPLPETLPQDSQPRGNPNDPLNAPLPPGEL